MNAAGSVRDLKLRLNVPDMDVPLFSALWPNWAAPDTRAWVVNNITTGRVHASKLSIAADLGASEGCKKFIM